MCKGLIGSEAYARVDPSRPRWGLDPKALGANLEPGHPKGRRRLGQVQEGRGHQEILGQVPGFYDQAPGCPTADCSLGGAGGGKPGWSLEVEAVTGTRLRRG